jgi:predicted DNA binding CopG/RHH family protein
MLPKCKRVREYARATMRKDKRVTIRISQRDLMELQRKAVHEGLPYQTFISSLLHKFVNGRMAEKPEH